MFDKSLYKNDGIYMCVLCVCMCDIVQENCVQVQKTCEMNQKNMMCIRKVYKVHQKMYGALEKLWCHGLENV